MGSWDTLLINKRGSWGMKTARRTNGLRQINIIMYIKNSNADIVAKEDKNIVFFLLFFYIQSILVF